MVRLMGEEKFSNMLMLDNVAVITYDDDSYYYINEIKKRVKKKK